MGTLFNGKSLKINENDLVLVIGESVGSNSSESLKLAHQLACGGEHGSVLFVNSFQRPQKFHSTVRQTLGEDYDINDNTDNLYYLSTLAGSLGDKGDLVDDQLRQGIKTVVINCWELSARDYRRREKLLYSVLEWLDQYSATVILCAQKSSILPKAGYMQRGGFGKLAAAADVVVKAYSDETTVKKEFIPRPQFIEDVVEYEAPSYSNEPHWDEEDGDKYRFEISPSGYKELIMLQEFPIEDLKAVTIWDEMGIEGETPKVYFLSNPNESDLSKTTSVFESRIVDGVNHQTTWKILKSDYEFPEVTPTEFAPFTEASIAEYLSSYRKVIRAKVNNDIVENKELRGTYLAAA